MSKRDFEVRSVNDLLKEYITAASAQGTATSTGDYRKANSQHDRVQAIYREFRSRGKSAQHVLLGLLGYPDEAVQCWAACHALEFAPQEAEPVLEKLSSCQSICGFNAEMTLKEWRKGSLKCP